MSTVKTLQIDTTSSVDTERLAGQLGQALRGGEVIELVADLGGGKTTFVRGLVAGLGSSDRVSSPTFTISKVYKTHDLEVHHFDFYRLQNAGLASFELHDLIGDPGVVVVVEWADVVEHALPEERLTITLERTGDDTRQLTVRYPESLSYLAEVLC